MNFELRPPPPRPLISRCSFFAILLLTVWAWLGIFQLVHILRWAFGMVFP
jgi:hypothetical protein